MERLNYIVEDSTIAELLGVQNFTNKESAVLELVKNAYDAQAKAITISFKDNKLFINDDGTGMDEKTIRNNWMHVGKSDKGYSLIDRDTDERVLSGSKGIGRFALARLGSSVEVYSAKEKSQPVLWRTNWDECIIDEWQNYEAAFIGTKILIDGLRDRWTEKAISNLAQYLSITYNDNKMHIVVETSEKKYNVSQYYMKSTLGKNCVSKILLKYVGNEKKLYCSFYSDEFTDEANKYCKNINLKHQELILDIVSELMSDNEIDLSEDELENSLVILGNFTSELYFSLKSSNKMDMESFLYKYYSLSSRYENGVVLYRNAFSISSFEGQRDWLEFGKRSRKSPAAATHPSGSWRVRENQISGKVIIDRKENECLKDLSNRQGLEEDDYYKLFTKIITIGIEGFERYRQAIIRLINKKNKPLKRTKTVMINHLLNNPYNAKNLSKDDINALSKELKLIKNESRAYREEKNSTEKKYKYDIRILNVLSTAGLKAASIAHELKNDRNSISVNYDYIVSALKEYDIWEELNSPECTKLGYNNVPLLLLRNKGISEKILVFMNTMLDEVEKQKFEAKSLSIYKLLEITKNNWMRDYASLNIILDIDEGLYFDSSEDIFTVIFDNLILNSLQQNDSRSRINISISIKKRFEHLDITYSDDGIGLADKFINDPMRILEVHETSRKNGHGLGMWIINNTLLMTGGVVNRIEGNNGFKIYFELGDKL